MRGARGEDWRAAEWRAEQLGEGGQEHCQHRVGGRREGMEVMGNEEEESR